MPCYLKTWNAEGEMVKIEVSEELYQLCATGRTFLVEIENAEGRRVPIEVSRPVYDLFHEGYRARERYLKECKNHMDGRGLDDYGVLASAVSEALECVLLRRERMSTVYDLLDACTLVQKERYYLHAICGYTYKEIAKLQRCSRRAVQKSVEFVEKRLKIFLSGG